MRLYKHGESALLLKCNTMPPRRHQLSCSKKNCKSIFLAGETNCLLKVSCDQGLHISGLLWTHLHLCLSSCREGTLPGTVFTVHLCCFAGQYFFILVSFLFLSFAKFTSLNFSPFSCTFGLQLCRSLSCSAVFFRVVSCCFVSCRVVSCRVVSCRFVSCLYLSC